jgi:hypothetical protein
LGLAKLFLGLQTLGDLFRHSLLKGRVQRLQFGFGFPALDEFALGGLEKSCVVDRSRRMAGYSEQRRLMLLLKFRGLRVPEESPPSTSPEREITGTAR